MRTSTAEERVIRLPENGAADNGESLVPIDLDLIPRKVRLELPLFVQVGEGDQRMFALVRNRGALFSDRVRDLLRKEKAPIFTKGKYFRAYEASVETHLEKILTDESVPLDKRATLLYQKGEDIMEAFFDRPHSKENYRKSQELVSDIVRLTHTSEAGVQSMMKLARRDYNTYSHSLHVCILGVGFSQALLSDKQLLRDGSFSGDIHILGQGFIYHDLGKSLIDAKILKKAGPLNGAEWEEIKKHPLDGAQMLQELGVREREIIQITLYHHERMNGTGYPYGLQADAIPAIARVAAITDAFDALTSDRPYKAAASTFQALSIMKNENAGFYDPALFQQFVLMFRRNPDTAKKLDLHNPRSTDPPRPRAK